MSIITVLTTKDDYTSPVRTESGQVVVNKDLLNKPANTYVYYDTDTDKYYNITENNTSPDYYNKIMNLQVELNKQNAFVSDGTDSTQINSFADVAAHTATNVVDSFKKSEGPLDLVKNIGLATIRAGLETADVIVNKNLRPAFELESGFGTKAGVLLNNFLVNLSETADYFTGAYAVKGLFLGEAGKNNLAHAYLWNEKNGRQNFDWDISLGDSIPAKVGSIIVNTVLEFFSDPTNLASIGAKTAMKSKITPALTDAITKNAKEIGADLDPAGLNKLVNRLTKRAINSEDIGTVLKGADLSPLIKNINVLSPDTFTSFVKTVSSESDKAIENLNLSILRSIKDTADNIGDLSAKLVLDTSLLKAGTTGLKLGYKVAEKSLSYAVSKLSTVLRKTKFVDGAPALSGLTKFQSDFVTESAKMADVAKVDKLIVHSAITNATAAAQRTAITKFERMVKKALSNGQDSMKAANAWAIEQGFKDIFDAYACLSKNQDRIIGGLKPILNTLYTFLKTYNASAVVKTMGPFVHMIEDIDNLRNMPLNSLNVMRTFLDGDMLFKINSGIPFDEADKAAQNVLKDYISYLIDDEKITNYMDQLDKTIPTIKAMSDKLDITASYKNIKANYLAAIKAHKRALSDLTDHPEFIKLIESRFNPQISVVLTSINKLIINLKTNTLSIPELIVNRALIKSGIKDQLDTLKAGVKALTDHQIKTDAIKFDNKAVKPLIDKIQAYCQDQKEILDDEKYLIHFSDVQFKKPKNAKILTANADINIDTTPIEFRYLNANTFAKITSLKPEETNKLPDLFKQLYMDVVNYLNGAGEKYSSDFIEMMREKLDPEAFEKWYQENDFESFAKALETGEIGYGKEVAKSNIKKIERINVEKIDTAEPGKVKVTSEQNIRNSHDILNDNYQASYARIIEIIEGAIKEESISLTDIRYLYRTFNGTDVVSDNSALAKLYNYSFALDGLLEKYTLIDQSILDANSYVLVLSKAYMLNALVSDERVLSEFDNILLSRGLGMALDIISSLDENYVGEANILKSLAYSTMLYNDLTAEAKNVLVKHGQEWYNAYIDTLSGLSQFNIKDFNAEAMTDYIIDKMQNYYVRGNSKMITFREHYLHNSVTPLRTVYEMARHDYGPHNAYTIAYSVKQVSKKQGAFSEIAIKTDRKTYLLINDSLTKVTEVLENNSVHTHDIYGMLPAEVKKQRIKDADYIKNNCKDAEVIHCATEDDLAKALEGILQDGYHAIDASKGSMDHIVFSSFGGSTVYQNTDKLMKQYLHRHNISVPLKYQAEYIDRLQVLNNYSVPDGLYDFVLKQIKHMKTKINDYNSNAVYQGDATISLVPNFDDNVMDAINSLSDALNDVAFNQRSGVISRAVEAIENNIPENATIEEIERIENGINAAINEKILIRTVNAETYRALSNLGAEQLTAARQALTELRSALADNLSSFKNTNRTLMSDIFIWQKERRTLYPNPMDFLKQFVHGSTNGSQGMLTYSLKRITDTRLMWSWFNLKHDIYKSGKCTVDVVQTTLDYAKRMQRTIESVTHPELLFDNSVQLMYLRADLEKFVINNVRTQGGSKLRYIMQARRKNLKDPLTNFAIARIYFYYIGSANASVASNFVDNMFAKYGYLWKMVSEPESSVMYKGLLYGKETLLKSPYFLEEVNPLLSIIKEKQQIDHAIYTADTFKESIAFSKSVTATYAKDTKTDVLISGFLEQYHATFAPLQPRYQALQDKYIKDVAKQTNSAMQFQVKLKFTEEVQKLNEVLSDTAKLYNNNRVRLILSIPNVEDYAYYLCRDCQGIQIFDMSSEVMKDPMNSKRFLNMCAALTAENSPVKITQINDLVYIQIKADHVQRIMKQKHELFAEYHLPYDESDRGFFFKKDAPETPIAYDPFTVEHRKYAVLLNSICGGEYLYSTQRVMNTERYKELLEHLPKQIKKNVLPLEWIYDFNNTAEKNGCQRVLFGFNQIPVGDYGFGTGTLFENFSNNIVTNSLSSANSIMARMQSRDIYLALFTNQNLSLQKRINLIPKDIPVTPTEVREALDDYGFVAVSYDGDKLIIHNITDDASLQHAFDCNAIVLDQLIFDKVQDVLIKKDELFSNPIFQNLIQRPALLLKLGQLQSPGWVLRNIPDSFLKGLLASDGGFDYIASVAQTRKTYNDFLKISTNIQSKYGSINMLTINKYFKETKESVLSKQLFTKINEFFESSSSAATTAQLNMLNDTGAKLYNKFGGNLNLTKAQIDAMLKSYVDHKGGYKETKKQLLSLYDEPTVESLMSLFGAIPDNYRSMHDTGKFNKILNVFTEYNPLMKWSTDIEVMSRLQSFLYNTETNFSTIGTALKRTDFSQFNRAHDSAGKKILELLFPFSSFAMDNALFWSSMMEFGTHSFRSVLNSYLKGRYDEEDITADEIYQNASVRYMFLNGNIYLDKNVGLQLKISDSFSSYMQLCLTPYETMINNLLLPVSDTISVLSSINNGEIGTWSKEDISTKAIELIPLFGAIYLREKAVWSAPTYGSAYAARIFPSIFGITKNYNVKPIGYNWYDQDEEYKKTHSFVYGISYVPAFIQSNPQTYADTFTRLKNMGYTEEEAREMIVDYGYYMKAPDYILKRFIPGVGSMKVFGGNKPPKMRTFKKAPTYVKKTHGRRIRSYPVKDYDTSLLSRVKMYHRQPRRIFRESIYSKRFGANGVPRHLMLQYRGNATCITRAIRKQVISRRQRTQRMSWWLGL